MNCCTGPIRDSGVMCSTAMEAPCIIDDGAFCRTVARPVTTLVVGFPAFMATAVGASWTGQYAQFLFLLAARCLNVTGVRYAKLDGTVALLGFLWRG